jgi:hypothetical protein
MPPAPDLEREKRRRADGGDGRKKKELKDAKASENDFIEIIDLNLITTVRTY